MGSHSPFSGHVADSNVAPRFCIGDVSEEAGELTHLGSLMPVSVRGCLIVRVPSLLGGRLHLWAVVFVCLRWWLVVGGCRMVVVVGGRCRWVSCRGCHWWHVALVAVVDS